MTSKYKIMVIGSDRFGKKIEDIIIQPKTKKEYEQTVANIYCKYRRTIKQMLISKIK
jgi:hypothetical protein